MPRAKSPLSSQPDTDVSAPQPKLSIRLDFGGGARIGPGKIVLLEEIGRHGSISAAGRALKMSYRRAWELVEDLNRSLGGEVVEAMTGGAGGGGARLTALGEAVIAHYRAIEREANQLAAPHFSALMHRGDA
ncbi:transcriptional regulator, LysR family [Acetobacteraceae bacterium AT-5844]|nr:transcriptional regulator, LysR family [Acetobacteraceae bacterium AT-5844]